MANSYYFNHDFSAFTDTKILFLRQQLGMEGYGIFWVILEQLGLSGGRLPLKIIPVLAMQMQTQEVKVKAVITEFDLFEIDGDGFFNSRLNDQLGRIKKMTEGGKIGAEMRWKNGGGIRGGIAGGITPPNAKREIKERKRESVKKAPPHLDDVKAFFVEKGFPVELGQRAYEYYTAGEWKDSNGNQVKNWKQKMIAVWMKPESKTQGKKMVI